MAEVLGSELVEATEKLKKHAQFLHDRVEKNDTGYFNYDCPWIVDEILSNLSFDLLVDKLSEYYSYRGWFEDFPVLNSYVQDVLDMWNL